MAIPLILAIGGRVAFTVIARAIAANRARAVAKYGAKAVKEAIKIAKKTTSKDKAVVNAAKKIVKSVLPKKPQTRTKPKFVKPAKRKKITGNVKPKPKPSKLPTKPQTRKGGSKPTKAKPKAKRVPEQFKTKPMIKVIKGKPTTITSKVKQKLKPKPKPSKLPTKPQKRRGGSKPINKRTTKPVVKGGKLAKALPAIVGGGLLLGGLVASMKNKKKDGVKVTVRDKPQRDTKFTGKIPPKNITKSVLPKKEQKRTGGSKPTMKISSYEDRVRAMVAKKDSLKNIDAADGSGRNKYQVEMNRLKKENPKEFRKLFTMGGFGKLKD